MAGTKLPLALSLLLFLFFFSFQICSIPSLASPLGVDHRNLLAYTGPTRRATGGPNCRELNSKEECDRNSQWCRWCTSDAIDDMCFGSAEAWRLPAQVFSCPTHRAA